MRKIFKRRAAKKDDAKKDDVQEFLEQSGAEVATTKEYVDWLEDYFEGGEKIIAVSSGDMGSAVYTVKRSAAFPLQYKAALKIIVPKGVYIDPKVKERYQRYGHSELYLHGGDYRNDVSLIGEVEAHVVLYRDSVRELKRRGYSLDDLNELYNGPEWNRKRDMMALRKAFFEASSPSNERSRMTTGQLRARARNGRGGIGRGINNINISYL